MEAQQIILSHVAKHISLTPAEQEIFLSLLHFKQVKKKEFLLRENEVCNYSAFVTSGCLKAYSVDDTGLEHILQFAPQNWWVTDMYSFITGKPANLNIDAIADTEMLLIYKKDVEVLYDKIPKFERYFRILLENALVASRQRVLDNLELTARSRFTKFCNSHPSLIHIVPQKQVASYIGVTPEFFSKLKAEYFRDMK